MTIELPNSDLSKFNGMIELGRTGYVLGIDQFLLKGTDLMNTEWIVGIVCYTG